MKRGYLNDYFTSVAVKRLSAVEINSIISNQHELNGTGALKSVLGTEKSESVEFSSRIIWMGGEGETTTADANVTWYDARRNHPTRSEYRLYVPDAIMQIMESFASPGDSLFIARRPDSSLLLVVTPALSTVEQQVRWLFDLGEDLADEMNTGPFQGGEISTSTELDLPARLILDELCIDIEEPEADFFDQLLEPFEGKLPPTAVFSRFARETLPEVSPLDDPDLALVAWLERETTLFRRMERHLIENRIAEGFVSDEQPDVVEGFNAFALSIQNSRKSRAGHAFENHIAAILSAHSVRFSRGQQTENRSRPDFLFPGIDEYRNDSFPATSLTMLGAKTTCKDRWRQVLTEAKRIPEKHLITVEPAISENQTDEMKAQRLQLVVPTPVQSSYRDSQQEWLLSLRNFLQLTRARYT